MSGDMMSFPDNWWTFVQQYQFADKDEVYTNGSMLIPSFRVRQMVEHYFGGEVGKTNRYAELFGTPERAAKTISTTAVCVEPETVCRDCEYEGYCSTGCGYVVLLEWLRGDA